MKNKFINKFEIYIGQDLFRSHPPMINFIINDHSCVCRLEDLKDWINEIWNSKGDRNEKAYKAKRNLDEFFATMLHPWMELPK